MKRILIPQVLECFYFNAVNSNEHKRVVKNYEFDLYLDGNHKICLDGMSYENTNKCLIFRKPGQFTVGKGDYNMYSLTLNFSSPHNNPKKLFREVYGEVQPLADFDELNNLPPVMPVYHFDELKEILQKLSACSYPSVTDIEMQNELIQSFLYLVFYEASKHNQNFNQQKTSLNPYVKSVCDYISLNFNTQLTVKSIAEHFHLNQNYLIKLFKIHLALTPNQYILETRLIRARHLLLHTNQTISEIAFSCGFNTPSYFSKKFKERFGSLPIKTR